MHTPAVVLFAAAALLIAPAAAQDQSFLPGKLIQGDGRPIMGDNLYTTVAVCDWNADGRKDLLVGMLYDGNVRLFLNQGSESDPAFGAGSLLEADGSPINVGYA